MRLMTHLAGLIAGLTMLTLAGPAAAQSADDAGGVVHVELNKFEAAEGTCRSYFEVENRLDSDVANVKLDVFLFDSAGEIQKRVALNTRELRAGKTYVRIFELSDLDCGGVGRLLLNEVLACELMGEDDGTCDRQVQVASRTQIPFDD
jgi:hypothetical protein